MAGDPFPLFSATLKAALGHRVRPEALTFLDMLGDDAVMEFPYAPEGSPRSVRGKAALAEYLDGIAAVVTIDRLDVERVLAVDGDRTVVVEMVASGAGRRSGTPYEQHYISVIDIDDGAIRRYRDYWNPAAFAAVLAAEAAR